MRLGFKFCSRAWAGPNSHSKSLLEFLYFPKTTFQIDHDSWKTTSRNACDHRVEFEKRIKS